jgi:ABC-type lipoprotein export system ATPase subunit
MNIMIVTIENLYKKFVNDYQGRFALFDFNANFKKNSFNLILGESGSGKTTLLKCLSCLMSPSKGSIYIDNNEITSLSKLELTNMRMKYFGFAFQELGLLEHLTCSENISFPNLSINNERALDLADYFKISNCLDKFPKHLSLGEKQRTSIARALYKNPKILIADEPTANLDWKNAKRTLELIKKYSSDSTTVFLATHDERAIEFATKILRLENGKLIEMKDIE